MDNIILKSTQVPILMSIQLAPVFRSAQVILNIHCMVGFLEFF